MTKKKEESIEVSGVRFTSKQVKSAVVVIDGREVHICEQKKENKIGFGQ